MKPKLGVEPPTRYLLRLLTEEGRTDLVEAYNAQNRTYQRALAMRNRERTIKFLEFRIEIAHPGSDAEARMKQRLAHEQAALEKLKGEGV